MSALDYQLTPGLRVLMKDLGVDVGEVLSEARLAEDLLARPRATVSSAEFFRLWQALEKHFPGDNLALAISEHVSLEHFDPTIFAAICSADLHAALERISLFKRLLGPMALDVVRSDDVLSVSLRWLDDAPTPPPGLVLVELVFFTQLARLATRDRIEPLRLFALEPLEDPDRLYRNYFGCDVSSGERVAVEFSLADARRPFVTANERMWEVFEPELRRRLAELETEASSAERVRAALVELLPAGRVSISDVARKLGTSRRTLQRRLRLEATAFQTELERVRERLAVHYLGQSALTGTEIAFLLGYDDPNSFTRAFHAWTGTTPESMRGNLQQARALAR